MYTVGDDATFTERYQATFARTALSLNHTSCCCCSSKNLQKGFLQTVQIAGGEQRSFFLSFYMGYRRKTFATLQVLSSYAKSGIRAAKTKQTKSYVSALRTSFFINGVTAGVSDY